MFKNFINSLYGIFGDSILLGRYKRSFNEQPMLLLNYLLILYNILLNRASPAKTRNARKNDSQSLRNRTLSIPLDESDGLLDNKTKKRKKDEECVHNRQSSKTSCEKQKISKKIINAHQINTLIHCHLLTLMK